jgi:hypothetical protein
MTKETDGGWSFEETLARTSEPRLWDRYQVEKKQPSPVLADLRRSLIASLLSKIGTKLFAAVPKTMKDGDGWAMLDRGTLEERIADERTDEIRLFAPLKAPNVAEHLMGQGLAETFQHCVLDDRSYWTELASVLNLREAGVLSGHLSITIGHLMQQRAILSTGCSEMASYHSENPSQELLAKSLRSPRPSLTDFVHFAASSVPGKFVRLACQRVSERHSCPRVNGPERTCQSTSPTAISVKQMTRASSCHFGQVSSFNRR